MPIERIKKVKRKMVSWVFPIIAGIIIIVILILAFEGIPVLT
jgi:hypothetical protein